MRAPLYASSEFPNANADLHAGRIDPELWPDVEDSFGDGEAEVVEELPELIASEAEIELVGTPPPAESGPRESMIRLVAAVSHDDDVDDDLDLTKFSSLTIPTLPPLDLSLLMNLEESDLDHSATHEVEPDPIDPVEVPVDLPVAVPVAVAIAPAVAPFEVDQEPAASQEPIDLFARLIETICEITLPFGVTAPPAAILEIFSGRPVPPVLLSGASGTLLASGIARQDEAGGIILVDKISGIAREWSKIIREEGGDFGACGGKTLDEFAADMACAIVGDRSKFDVLKRALRERGVAAFGLLCDAA